MHEFLGISKDKRRILNSIHQFGQGPFSAKDISEYLNIPISNVQSILIYLTSRGWLSRIKKGLYITVPLGINDPKNYTKSFLIIANKIFAPCYISGFTAASHWNFTEQIFRDVIVVTSKMFRHNKTKVNGTTFILKYEKCLQKKDIVNVWEENTKIFMASPTQTIVDILNKTSLGGGIRHIAKITEEYFESKYFDESKLLECIKLTNNKTIYKRLGYLMQKLNIKNEHITNTCLKNISAGYSYLDPDIKSKGKIIRKWNLRINAEL